MINRSYLLVLVPLLLHIGIARAQESYPIMERVAEKVIQKYQTSSCQDLAKRKGQRPTGQKAQIEQRVHLARGAASPKTLEGLDLLEHALADFRNYCRQ